jgi:hypothetical protein
MGCGLWQNCPVEIILEILLNLPISHILSFTSSCRHFYHSFGNPEFLSLLLRMQLRWPLSDAYWFLPVATVKGEVEQFRKACEESILSELFATTSASSDVSIVFDANFPLLEFFRINYRTDSMKNRRRLWRISRQFREEWYRYRTEGRERSHPVTGY